MNPTYTLPPATLGKPSRALDAYPAGSPISIAAGCHKEPAKRQLPHTHHSPASPPCSPPSPPFIVANQQPPAPAPASPHRSAAPQPLTVSTPAVLSTLSLAPEPPTAPPDKQPQHTRSATPNAAHKPPRTTPKLLKFSAVQCRNHSINRFCARLCVERSA